MRTITTPFISSNVGDIVQDIYTQMVDIDQDTLFQMHAGADYLDIKPLLELTSLAIMRSRTELHLNVRTQFRLILTGARTMFNRV